MRKRPSQKKGKKGSSKIPSKADSGRKHGGLLPGTAFACGTDFYTTDDQGRVFNQHGEQVYQEGEVQMVEETDDDDDDLGVLQLSPDDDDDDKAREGQRGHLCQKAKHRSKARAQEIKVVPPREKVKKMMKKKMKM